MKANTTPSNSSNSQKRITSARKSAAKHKVSIDAVHQHLKSFEGMNIPNNCSSIDVSRNRFRSFLGLPSLKFLTHMTIDNCPLFSFLGATSQPSLFWISFKNTPLSKHTHFKLMCVVVFGSSLKYINDEPVGKSLIQKADKIRSAVIPELIDGKILISLNSPFKYVIPQEKRSCTATFTTQSGSTQENLEMLSQQHEPEPSLAAICHKFLKEKEVFNFIGKEKIEGIRNKLRDMREHFQVFEEEEDEGNETVLKELGNEEEEEEEIGENNVIENDEHNNDQSLE